MPLYVVHCPQTYNLMELQGKAHHPSDILRYLCEREDAESILNGANTTRQQIFSLLDFDDGNRKFNFAEMFGLPNSSQEFVATQIAKQAPEAEVVLTDGRRKSLSEVSACDAVFTTAMSSNFPTSVAETIALNRALVPVVLGGIHVSTSPQDVDIYIRSQVPNPQLVSSVIGPGDSDVIRMVLHDLQHRSLQKEYRGSKTIEDGVWGNADVQRLDPMKMDLLKKFPIVGKLLGKMMSLCPATPFVGCPYSCDFCSISGVEKDQRKLQIRSPDDFIEELRWQYDENGKRFFIFLPDNLLLGGKRLEEMLDRMIDDPALKINFVAQISIEVADKPDLLKKMRQAGASHFFVGFESLDLENLRHVGKHCVTDIERTGGDVRKYYAEKIRRIQDAGISVHGSFISGLPHDFFHSLDDHSGRNVADFCIKNKIGMQYTALTDLPGSAQFERSIQDGTHLFGTPGSMGYLTGLCLTDLTESNRIPPNSLYNSPLVVSWMGYDAIRRVGSTSNALRCGAHMAFKALRHPVRGKSRNTMDRLFHDPALAFGSQLVVSQFIDHANATMFSHDGIRGSFARLYESEKNPWIRKMFANIPK